MNHLFQRSSDNKSQTYSIAEYPRSFGRSASSPPKNPVIDHLIIDYLTSYARFANYGYCLPDNEIGKVVVGANGHGIGGAYAVLAALAFYKEVEAAEFSRMNELHGVQLLVQTYGQPRIGNKIFALLVNQLLKVYRLTHTIDPIPQYPRDDSYYHHEQEFWLSFLNCDCLNSATGDRKPIIIDGSYILYQCDGFYEEKAFAGENEECNASQMGSKEIGYMKHKGPYFGVTMGYCAPMWQRWW
ncbi:hypothetical protein G9A89_001457 [Geosiphon pyriformis]|nr:hypothetical protein G9A89_001457 [Geosiphon pyriformis]